MRTWKIFRCLFLCCALVPLLFAWAAGGQDAVELPPISFPAFPQYTPPASPPPAESPPEPMRERPSPPGGQPPDATLRGPAVPAPAGAVRTTEPLETARDDAPPAKAVAPEARVEASRPAPPIPFDASALPLVLFGDRYAPPREKPSR